MRSIILTMSVSLDGFFEGPDRQIDWHLVDDELHSHFNDWLSGMGAFLSGRVTYELMAEFWPTADSDPSSTGPVAEFAGIWRDMPKIVYSRTLERADWNTTIVREVVVEEILALKAQPGGDLVLGGADLAATFMQHDLIDEYRIYVHPVLIGRGKPLFRPSDTRFALHLAETRTFGNGVVLLHYRRTDHWPRPGPAFQSQVRPAGQLVFWRWSRRSPQATFTSGECNSAGATTTAAVASADVRSS